MLILFSVSILLLSEGTDALEEGAEESIGMFFSPFFLARILSFNPRRGDDGLFIDILLVLLALLVLLLLLL